jgi:hypothetical protein
MNLIRAVAAMLILLCALMGGQTKPQNQNAPWNLRYTLSEYNALQRASREEGQAKQIELLDAFVSQYPDSDLLVYVYPLYYNAFTRLRNFPKVFEYADKLIALGDKAPATAHYSALCAWTAAYNSSNSQDAGLAAKARDRALAGLKLIASLVSPSGIDEKTFEAEKKRGAIHMQLTAEAAEFAMRDYVAASESIKAMQALDVYDPRPLTEPKLYTTGF